MEEIDYLGLEDVLRLQTPRSPLDPPAQHEGKHTALRRFTAMHQRVPRYGDCFEGFNIGSWYLEQRRALRAEQRQRRKKPSELSRWRQLAGNDGVVAKDLDRYIQTPPRQHAKPFPHEDYTSALCEFVNREKRLPNSRDVWGKLPLGRWYLRRRSLAVRGGSQSAPFRRLAALDPLVQKDLEDHLYGIDFQRAQDCLEFAALHKRPPDTGLLRGWYRRAKFFYHRDPEQAYNKYHVALLLADPHLAADMTRNPTRNTFPTREKIRLCIQFVRKNGRVPNPKDRLPEFDLGVWYRAQRSLTHRGQPSRVVPELCKDPTIREDLTMFSCQPGETLNEAKVDRFLRFVETHREVPSRNTKDGEWKIGYWFNTAKRRIADDPDCPHRRIMSNPLVGKVVQEYLNKHAQSRKH